MSLATARKDAVALATDDPWLSMPQAAAAMGCTRHKVGTEILLGRLTAQTVAGRTFVLRDSVDLWCASRGAAAAGNGG